jgi:8-oxo-dGTP pyrophosphatase MutT (NUDIX family)
MMSNFDIFDEHDQSLNKVATFDEVHQLGYWHRGIHVIIYTPHKEIVMQKRSLSLSYHPGEIEISVGGGVDAGELPIDAVVRETKEELGITLDKTKIRFLGKTKFNHRSKMQFNKVFLYSYAICVPKHDIKFAIDTSESSQAFFISKHKLKLALVRHRIKHFGKISSMYSYWVSLLNAVQ